MLTIHRPRAERAVVLLGIVAAAGLASCEGATEPVKEKPPVPVKFVQIIGGRDQVDTIGATLALPIQVRLVDSASLPLVGSVRIQAIRVEDPRLAGELPARSATLDLLTATDGTGSTTLTLGLVSGTWRVEAREFYGKTADTATFTTLPGNPAHITITPADSAVYVANHYQTSISEADRANNPRTDPIELAVDSASAVASVGSTGVITGVDFGRARIRVGVVGWPVTENTRVSVVPRGVLAVAMGQHTSNYGVAVVALDGSSFKQLVTGTGGAYLFPSWNADGTRIGYNASDLFNGRLFEVDLNGVVKPFTHLNELSSETWMRYSADGRYVYYTAGYYPDSLDTYRLPTDASGTPERVTPPRPGSTRYWKASPSRDGAMLAYSDAGFGLHVMAIGTGADRLVNNAQGWPEAPRFSPDGNWIAYGDEDNRVLHLIHPDGTGERRLPAPDAWVNHWGHDWSPDGGWIVMRALETLWIVRLADGLLIPLPYSGNMLFPSWRQVP